MDKIRVNRIIRKKGKYLKKPNSSEGLAHKR